MGYRARLAAALTVVVAGIATIAAFTILVLRGGGPAMPGPVGDFSSEAAHMDGCLAAAGYGGGSGPVAGDVVVVSGPSLPDIRFKVIHDPAGDLMQPASYRDVLLIWRTGCLTR